MHRHGYQSFAIQWCIGERKDKDGKWHCIHEFFPPRFRYAGPKDQGFLGPIEYWYISEYMETNK